jgi:hypothetical protein
MSRSNPRDDLAALYQLRRCILLALYDMFREYPYASIELSYLQEACACAPQDLNWNIVYLEKKGYVELDKSSDCPPYIACTVTVNAAGIDLIEDQEKFNRRFPE